ncbi:ATP-binding protein [Streptomyces rubrogriseus]|uniref:ATP-binding protein n=1 Tax=Streptomyces rubrogriseus TaxID=194673 RepID=UPI003702668B
MYPVANPTALVAPSVPGAAAPPGLEDETVRQAIASLPAQDAAACLARQFAARLLRSWNISGDAEDSALLIVSELATNAALHGRSDMTIRLAYATGALRITVADHGKPQMPPMPTALNWEADEHGRGLFIVSALATHLEVFDTAQGWYVDATLDVGA